MKSPASIAAALLVLSVSAGFSACAPIDTGPMPALVGPDVNRLQPGVSTLRDAIVELGPSMAETNMGDGTRLYQWGFDVYRYGSPRYMLVSITFDSANVMIGVESRVEVPY